MTFRCVNPKRKQTRLRPLYLAVASLAVLIAAGADAGARSGEHSIESIESRSTSEPIMAIVSLRNQRITVYDAKGWILRAPVSSGQKGRETPAGIFSVIQKVEAQEAGRKAAQARLAAGTAFREATQAMAPVRAAENLKLRAEAQLAAAETKLGSGISAEAKEQAEGVKAQAVAKIAELQVQWDV